jgi:hypothetical protein
MGTNRVQTEVDDAIGRLRASRTVGDRTEEFLLNYLEANRDDIVGLLIEDREEEFEDGGLARQQQRER